MNLIILLLICINFQSSNNDFYEKVTNIQIYLGRTDYYLALECHFKNDSGSYVIKNNKLYSYLKHRLKIEKDEYKEYINLILHNKMPLKLEDTNPGMFIKVQNSVRIDSFGFNDTDEFISTYFTNGVVLRDGIDAPEKAAIIYKLFNWKIASYVDDETGYLVISR